MEVQKVRLFDAVDFSVVDYESASDIVISNAMVRQSFGVFAMPVHGLVLSVTDPEMRSASNRANLVVPDGQPVRWLMNFFYKTGLRDRVYGPLLTLHVLKKASEAKLKVFLYGGNTEQTLNRFAEFIQCNYPGVIICGQYREPSPNGITMDGQWINDSGANIILVGRGCPAQEMWIASQLGKVNGVMLGIGAAFSFHAGVTQQAPKWMQDNGLEWLFRLIKEPNRLFKRYFLTNTAFLMLLVRQFIKMKILGINNQPVR